MATLLMSCDEYVYENNGTYYVTSNDWLFFFQRYLRVFDRLKLAVRCENTAVVEKNHVPINDSRIEVVPIPMFHGPLAYATKYFSVGKSIEGVLNDCDAAILRIPSTVAMRVGKKVMRKHIPYACEVVFDAEDGWKASTGLTRLIWKKIDKDMRKMCSRADGVSCVTEHYLQQHYFPSNSNAFTEHYSSLALDKSFYGSEKKAPTHKPIILAHVANVIGFNDRKGTVELIQALPILKAKGCHVIARFAAKDRNGVIPDLKKYAESLGVGECVEFVGFLNREQLDLFLSESDIFVFPTVAEGLPRVIIEAMSKGLPCITTPVSGNPELVDPHFLVEYSDIQSLAARIEELINDAGLYERTSTASFKRSLQYEASVLEKRRDGFYENLKKYIR